MSSGWKKSTIEASTVKYLTMRIAVLSADYGLFYLLCIYLIYSGTTITAESAEDCEPDNCLSGKDKCSVVSNAVCKNPGDTCCTVVKSEFATKCKQFGGICRSDFCGLVLQRTAATDCADNEVCCVLVV